MYEEMPLGGRHIGIESMHDDEGHWGTVSEAAQAFGVSVDTVRRRIKQGELDTRREQTPQGFRWLIRLPDQETAPASPGSPQTAETVVHGPVVVYGPDPRDTLIETLQRELELRNREVARLHEVISQQAQAIERAAAAIPASLTTSRQDAPESTHEASQVSGISNSLTPDERRRGFWNWLRGR